MKLIVFGLCILLLCGCAEKNSLNGLQLLEKTIAQHDSLNLWHKTRLDIHIQEPRLANPHRYSILKLDNSKNTFELSRNRDQYISTHVLDNNANSYVLLDGKRDIDSVLKKRYRLDASRNIGYKNFYHLMCGLPMSLNKYLHTIRKTTKTKFNEEECYKIEIELKEKMISKHWNVFISEIDYKIKGVEIIFPDDPNKGERLYFNGDVVIDNITIPRFRHWHELKDDSYSGSDIIIKEITE